MLTYAAPLDEYRFIWRNVLNLPSVAGDLTAHAHLDADLFEATLEAASRLAQEQLLPLSASGDRQGCRLVDGKVKTPDGFPEVYRHFQQGGWPALTVPRASGGQGFPGAVGALFEEMVASTNLAFGIFTHV